MFQVSDTGECYQGFSDRRHLDIHGDNFDNFNISLPGSLSPHGKGYAVFLILNVADFST